MVDKVVESNNSLDATCFSPFSLEGEGRDEGDINS
jgi:hypothetical protein